MKPSREFVELCMKQRPPEIAPSDAASAALLAWSARLDPSVFSDICLDMDGFGRSTFDKAIEVIRSSWDEGGTKVAFWIHQEPNSITFSNQLIPIAKAAFQDPRFRPLCIATGCYEPWQLNVLDWFMDHAFVHAPRKEWLSSLGFLDVLVGSEGNIDASGFPRHIRRVAQAHGRHFPLKNSVLHFNAGSVYDHILCPYFAPEYMEGMNAEMTMDRLPADSVEHGSRDLVAIPAGIPRLDNIIQAMDGWHGPVEDIVYHLSHWQLESKFTHENAHRIVQALLDGFPDRNIIFRPFPSDQVIPAIQEIIDDFKACPRFRLSSASSYVDDYLGAAILIHHCSTSAELFGLATDRPVLQILGPDDRKDNEYGEPLHGIGGLVEKVKCLLASERSGKPLAERAAFLANPGTASKYVLDCLSIISVDGPRPAEWRSFPLFSENQPLDIRERFLVSTAKLLRSQLPARILGRELSRRFPDSWTFSFAAAIGLKKDGHPGSQTNFASVWLEALECLTRCFHLQPDPPLGTKLQPLFDEWIVENLPELLTCLLGHYGAMECTQEKLRFDACLKSLPLSLGKGTIPETLMWKGLEINRERQNFVGSLAAEVIHLRKQIGCDALKRNAPAEAIPHFQRILEIQPWEKDAQSALQACYDSLQKNDSPSNGRLSKVDQVGDRLREIDSSPEIRSCEARALNCANANDLPRFADACGDMVVLAGGDPSILHRLEPVLAKIRRPPPGRESALAHRLLDGLRGLEIGGSAHNPFGLNTRNVGMINSGYIAEQIRTCGSCLPIDIETDAAALPVPDESEDFVVSSHVLEHTTDVARTLLDWFRVVRPGGYLYIVVPLPGATSADDDKPHVTWRHVFEDLVQGAVPEMEPEQDAPGNNHYHLLALPGLEEACRHLFGERCEVAARQEIDDKVGNGCTLVLRKRVGLDGAFPWKVAAGGHEAEIVRRVARTGVSLLDTDLASRRRHALEEPLPPPAVRAAALAEWNGGWDGLLARGGRLPVVLGADPRHDASLPEWFRQGSRDGMARLEPLGVEWIEASPGASGFGVLAETAFRRAEARETEWFGVLLSPCLPTPRLLALLRQKMTPDRDAILVGADRIRELDARGVPIAGGVSPRRIDLVLVRAAAWRAIAPSIPPEATAPDLLCAFARNARTLPILRGGHLVGLPDDAVPTSRDPLWKAWVGNNWAMGVPYKDYGEDILRRLAQEHPQGVPAEHRLVNIGIVTYNRLEFTRQTLDSLHEHTSFPHVVTVIDNHSTDGSREYLQEQKRLGRIDNLVLLDENVGVAKASNLAWSLVPEATHYLKLDNDIVLRKDGWLDEMVRVVDALPEVGVVAYSFEPISFPLVEIRGVRIRPKNGNLGGACILIPKRTEEKLGVWCEDFGIYGEEDLDYGFRVQVSGLVNAYMEDEDMGFHLPAGKAAVIDTGTWLAADGKEELVHAEYRRMKDENRARNHQSGIVEANFKAYLAGTKPLKLESAFVRARAASQPFVVLVCTLNPPLNGCAYLRVVQHLRRHPGVEALWNSGAASPSDFARALERCDIVLVQRGFVENRPAMEAIRRSGKPWVFEIDDLLWEDLPSWNPHAEEFRAVAPLLVEALRTASATIASTPVLGLKMEEHSRDVHVVPNLLDPEVWPPVPARGDAGKILIAYAGTATHTADLLLVEDVLERIARIHGDRVGFVFMGCVTPRLARLPGAKLVEYTDDYPGYARSLAAQGIDIALAPLQDHPFNRAKSAIKWLEYSACRAAGVYADLDPYREVVRDGENGFLVGSSPDDWFERVDLLVRDPALRRKLSEVAHDEARATHSLVPQASPLVDALRTIRAEWKRPVPDAAGSARAAPRVSIVIPVHGKLDLTRDCVRAVKATTDAATTEIIVVDDASPDGTAAWLRERKSAGDLEAVHFETNRGFAHACNAGARAARGGILVFLNNDTLPEAGWLDALVRTLADIPSVGMVGARLLYPNRTVQHAGIQFHPGGMPFHVHRGAAADDPAVLREAAFPAVTGACVAMPADLYRKLGGFNESYRMYVEDIDLCLKVWEAGREVRYCPDSVVIHLESASSTDLERRDAMVREGLGKLHANWSGHWPSALRKVEGFPARFFGDPAPLPARLQWISPVWDPSGYADESRAFLKHLSSTDLGVAARPWGRHSESFRQSSSASDREILDSALARDVVSGSPVVFDIPAHAMGRFPGAGHHVGRTFFETDGLPPDWVARCNQMDEIWVCGSFNKETFAKAGVTCPILVVPGGVDTDKFRPSLAPLDLPGPRKGLTYLAVFEWTHRKAPDLLLQAWATAFSATDDVKLVLRTYPPNQIEGDPAAWVEAKIDEELARIGKRRADCAPIAVIAKQVSDADMPRLYAGANVYLAPSRGEGWGRPHMEAMSCGVPVVATRWSGNLDFQTDDNSWLIDIDGLEEIDAREEFPFYRGQKWAKPSLTSFIRALRESREDQGLRRAKGERARRDMQGKWDWSKIAPLAELRLREILAGIPAADSRLHRWGAPETAKTDSVTTAKPIRWAGPVFNYSGYARLARETLKGLMDAGVPVSCDPQLNDKEFFAALSGKDAEIARWKDLLAAKPVPGPLVVCDLPRDAKGGDILAALARDNAACGKRICWTMFETDRLPEGWASALNTLDEVWVPSHFNRATFARSGVTESKIHVIPGCIDPAPYANARPTTLPGAGYTFLSVFQWIERKGWDILLDAWSRAFKPTDPVRLVLRCHPFGKAEPVAKQLDQFLSKRGLRRSDLAPLHLIEEFVPDDALPGLFAACDCFVLPTRGEGWGLPYLEAMAAGKPVIGTRWSAPDDFLTSDNSWLLSPRDPVSVSDEACREVPFLTPSHRWANPSSDELAELLRHAFEHPEEGRAKGRQGQRDATTRWTPGQTARAIVERLAAPPPVPSQTSTTSSRAPTEAASGKRVSNALARIADGLKGKTSTAPIPTSEPSPTPAASDSFLSIRWEGSQFVHHSLAHVNRQLCLHLAKKGHDLSLIPFEPDQFGPGDDADLSLLAQLHNAPLEGPCQVHVRHQWPPNLEGPSQGRWVVIQPWEFGSPPKEWIPVFSRQVDELWAYTNHVRDMYLAAGVPADKVFVVPLGVDCDKFRPDLPPFALATRKTFKFLFVGGTIARKGFDVLLNAWKQAFGPHDDVCLVVKDMGGGSFYKGQTAKAWIREMQDSRQYAEIEYLDGDLEPRQIPSLYAGCDVLVHPYRGEGFGLPIAEAMACGLPCVVTRGGAADDFCGESESWGVQAERVPVPGGKVGPFETVAAPWWLEPSVPHLVERLREAFSDTAARRAKGEAARSRIANHFTWEQAASIAARRLQELAHRESEASRPAPGKLTISSLDKLARSITMQPAMPEPSNAPASKPPEPEDELEEMGRMLLLAEASAARGGLAEADRITEDVVGKFPRQNMAWLARAMVLRGLGRFKKAADAIAKALQVRETPEALLEAMQIHLLADEAAPARKAEKALKERHAAWFKATREEFRAAGKPWPPDFTKPTKKTKSGPSARPVKK